MFLYPNSCRTFPTDVTQTGGPQLIGFRGRSGVIEVTDPVVGAAVALDNDHRQGAGSRTLVIHRPETETNNIMKFQNFY